MVKVLISTISMIEWLAFNGLNMGMQSHVLTNKANRAIVGSFLGWLQTNWPL